MLLWKVLLFRQQEAVPRLDALALLHVVELPDLPPAVTVSEMTHRQVGETFVTSMQTSLSGLAGMYCQSCIQKINYVQFIIPDGKTTGRHVGHSGSLPGWGILVCPGSGISTVFK